MSDAEPMSNIRRAAVYAAQNGTERPDAFTGPQNRRMRHHQRRALQTDAQRATIVARRGKLRRMREAFSMSTEKVTVADLYPLPTDGKGKQREPVTRTERRMVAKWARKQRKRRAN